jgi:hypothetical protein
MRYLSKSEAVRLANANRAIEQFLSPKEEAGVRVLSWVCIEKEREGGFLVSRFDVFDEGNLEHLDLYSFSFVDPDSPCEEVRGLETASSAVDVAVARFGANADKFVNAGVIQDEYADFLRAVGQAFDPRKCQP